VTYARKVDSTHKAVVEAFRAAGWHVLSTFRLPNAPDLFVAKAGRTVAVEVKGPKTKVTAGQQSWHADWPGETAIVRTVEDVMRLSR
jgi:hypothetical protein